MEIWVQIHGLLIEYKSAELFGRVVDVDKQVCKIFVPKRYLRALVAVPINKPLVVGFFKKQIRQETRVTRILKKDRY